MRFEYVCKDLKLSEAMKRTCENKFGNFEHYFKGDEESKCLVTISILSNEKIVEATISNKSFMLRAKAADEDFYSAVDLACEKLNKQMRKTKTRLTKNSKKNSLKENLLLEHIISDEYDEESLNIVKKKSLNLAPMDVEEALTRMYALGHSFFIYLDSSTGLVNVLYEREDKGYGVIEIHQ